MKPLLMARRKRSTSINENASEKFRLQGSFITGDYIKAIRTVITADYLHTQKRKQISSNFDQRKTHST